MRRRPRPATAAATSSAGVSPRSIVAARAVVLGTLIARRSRAGASPGTRARPSRKSSLRDDSSSAKASFAQVLRRASSSAPAWSSHLVRPSATVGPGGQPRRRARSASASTSSAGDRAVHEPPLGGLGAARARGRAAAAPGPGPRRPGAAAATSPPLSGVKPRSANGSQKRASSAAIGEVGGQRELEADAGRPAPHRAHDRAPATVAISGISRWAWRRQPALDAADPRSRSPGAALRATMSTPPQKWSPAPVSTMTRTASSRPARVERVDQRRRSSSSSMALRLSGRSSVEPQHRCRRARRRARRRTRSRSSVAAHSSREPVGDRVERALRGRRRRRAGRAAAPDRARGSAAGSWRGPGVVTSPRWFSAREVEVDRRPVALGQVLARDRARAATGCRRRS